MTLGRSVLAAAALLACVAACGSTSATSAGMSAAATPAAPTAAAGAVLGVTPKAGEDLSGYLSAWEQENVTQHGMALPTSSPGTRSVFAESVRVGRQGCALTGGDLANVWAAQKGTPDGTVLEDSVRYLCPSRLPELN